MDIDIRPAEAQPATTSRRFTGYLTELKEELKKVSWTSKSELLLSTKVVIVATFVLGLGIYVIDLLIKTFLDNFAMIMRWIFG